MALALFVLMLAGGLMGQLQQSGGASINGPLPAGSNTIGAVNQAGTWTVNQAGTWTVTQGGAWSINQGGTWTVQPGNTPNTVPWFVRMVPLHGCAGNTLQDVTQVDVATGAGSDLTSADTCVFRLYINNKTAAAVTVTIEDRQGTPVSYSTGFSLPANSDIMREFGGMRFVSGVKMTAGTAGALNARLLGVQ